MAQSMPELFALHEISADVYETLHHPEQMGNANSIAYGGCTLAAATNAAHFNIPDGYRCYSLLGNYLGPALTDRNLRCMVKEIRKTRTFITKLVEVYQKQDDASSRGCLVMLADFHLKEAASVLTYSKSSTLKYKAAESYPTPKEQCNKMVAAGQLSQEAADTIETTFGLMSRMFDQRLCSESMLTQTMVGIAKEVETTQESLSIVDRTSADWFKVHKPVKTRAEQASCLAFVIDQSIAFIPLTHSKMFIREAGACSSLDFALRIFVNDFDLNDWHLREWKTIAGEAGRTYSEAQMWDRNGNMVASMTQASILRPKQQKATKL